MPSSTSRITAIIAHTLQSLECDRYWAMRLFLAEWHASRESGLAMVGPWLRGKVALLDEVGWQPLLSNVGLES